MVQPTSYQSRHPGWKKPSSPYQVGVNIQVHSYKPPSPPEMFAPTLYDDLVEQQDSSPLDRCLKHPPPPGEDGEGQYVLEILELVHASDGLRSQLVRVRVRPSGETDNGSRKPHPPFPDHGNVVAKFYDPLYFDHNQDESDPFKSVNCGFCFEAAAYTRMSNLQGGVIPKYYGSYTTSFPTPGEDGKEQKWRHVRLILIEFIQGSCMQHLNPQDFTQHQRQRIVGCIIDAETAVYTNDITLLDLYPRNLILTPNNRPSAPVTRSNKLPPQSQEWRVVLIDFETLYMDRRPPYWINHFGRQHFLPGTVISPLLRWARDYTYESFEDWVDWDWQPWIAERYGEDKAGITDHMKQIWGPGLA